MFSNILLSLKPQNMMSLKHACPCGCSVLWIIQDATVLLTETTAWSRLAPSAAAIWTSTQELLKQTSVSSCSSKQSLPLTEVTKGHHLTISLTVESIRDSCLSTLTLTRIHPSQETNRLFWLWGDDDPSDDSLRLKKPSELKNDTFSGELHVCRFNWTYFHFTSSSTTQAT